MTERWQRCGLWLSVASVVVVEGAIAVEQGLPKPVFVDSALAQTNEITREQRTAASRAIRIPKVPSHLELTSRWRFIDKTQLLLITNCYLTITGRGGLLLNNPSEPLNGEAIEVDLVSVTPKEEKSYSPTVSTDAATPMPVVEAQGLMISAKGEVSLTNSTPSVTPHSPWHSVSCRSRW